MELLIVQSHGAKNKLRGDNVEDSLIPSVEQKMVLNKLNYYKKI